MSENTDTPVYGSAGSTPESREGLTRVTRLHHLAELKTEGRAWPMLTAYDFVSARLFQEAGIPVLLVGDSAANVVYGYDTTVPVGEDEMIPLVRAVTRGAPKALVVADLVFGSYEASPTLAVAAATRMMKEGGAQAVKLEGGARMAPQIRAIAEAGIPVMAHIGFTPQSEHQLGGYRVQGRDEAADDLVAQATALEAAGAFGIVLEMVPAEAARRITASVTIPTVGIGAGPHCDAQVLVWQDMMGLRTGRMPRFVKQYADLATTMTEAAQAFAADVAGGSFPAEEHSF